VEFESVYRAYRDSREGQYKDGWTRMRMLATITIQPHVKNKISPEKLLPFPWEKQGQELKAPKPTSAESKSRFEKLVTRLKN
jgi:hypothetical protein